jgi:hypothetical protein
MRHNREETKSFNAKEKVKMMVTKKKGASIEGKQHAQVRETLQQRREKE